MKILAIYLAAINAAAFVVMAVDKYRAQHQQWRVRESTLMLLALLGGSLGTLLAMWACHHKTQHKKFTILVPLLLVLQTVLVVVLAIASKQ